MPKTCSAHRGFDEKKQFGWPGLPPYHACEAPATHVEIEDDMRAYLCAAHAAMWSKHDPALVIVPL